MFLRQAHSACQGSGVAQKNWLLIEATLMTSQAIEAYGGIQFSREALEMGADSVDAGDVPVQVDHDQAQPVRVRNLRAWVDDGTDGFYRLKLAYEIHPEDAHYVAQRLGMSAETRAPIDGRDYLDDLKSGVELSADHAWFEDDALLESESSIVACGLSANFIRTDRVYQFSFAPDPHIFITVVLPLAGSVAAGALGSALWDAVKALFRRRRTPPNGDPHTPTRMNLRLEDGERSLTGIVETEDEAVANRAIDTFDGLVREFMATASSPEEATNSSDRSLPVWNDAAAAWLPHSPARVEQQSPPPISRDK